MNLESIILPVWAKPVAYAVLVTFIFGYGYVKGLEKANNKQLLYDTKIVVKQGKVTEKLVTKYVYIRNKQTKKDTEIRNEGNGYAIRFPNDTYRFNNEYVRLFNSSVLGEISSLPSGKPAGNSGVTVSENLSVSINNNEVARKWKLRAEECEEWTKEQEKVFNK